MNNLKTFFLLTLLTLLAIGVGDYFGGQNGMILGFIIAGVTNFVSYFFSDKIPSQCTVPNQSPGNNCQEFTR